MQKTTRAAFAQRVESEITEDEITRYHTIWGRLGYVPIDFDLRAASRADAARVGAFYEPDIQAITAFEETSVLGGDAVPRSRARARAAGSALRSHRLRRDGDDVRRGARGARSSRAMRGSRSTVIASRPTATIRWRCFRL